MQNSLVPRLFGRAESGKPRRPAAQDRRRGGDRLHVVHRRRAAIEADIGGKRRLQPRHALLALERLQQPGLLAADIGAGAMMDVEIERPAVNVVLADQPRLIGLIDCGLQALALQEVFAAHIDVAGVGAHRERGEQAALDQRMRVVAHDLAVLAGARLRFVSVDHEIGWARRIGRLGHERPFEPGRETRAAAPAQAGGLHLVDDPVASLVDQRLGVVPAAAGARAFQAEIAEAVEIGEDAVLVLKHRAPPSRRAPRRMTGRPISARRVRRRHRARSATSGRRSARS